MPASGVSIGLTNWTQSVTKTPSAFSSRLRNFPFRLLQGVIRLKRSNIRSRPFIHFSQRTVARAKAKRPRAVAESVIPKEVLAKEVAKILEDQELTQTEAAYLMRDAPSQISLVVTGKLRGFSTERLLRMLARLGRDVDIVIRPSKSKTGKVSVVRR